MILSTKGGKTYLSLSPGNSKDIPDGIACSVVGLYNVLSGVEYHALTSGLHCLVRLQGNNVELVWKRGRTDTVFRLSVPEYRNLLGQMSDGSQRAA